MTLLQQLKECQTLIERPYTDFDELYCNLRMSALGAQYTPDVFLRTPISILLKASKLATIRDCEIANAHSHTTAQLLVSALSIAHGFSGSRSKFSMSDPDVFLPYPNLKELKTDKDKKGPSNITQSILVKLLKLGLIPMPIYAQLNTASS